MLRMLLGLAAVAAVGIWLAGSDLPSVNFVGQGANCTIPYTIKRGDTLSEIAERIYGRNARYTEIIAANRSRLSDPTKIAVGDTIRIPCPDSASASGRASARATAAPAQPPRPDAVAMAPRAATPAAATPVAAPEPSIRLVTAASFAPFAGRDLERGGLLGHLVIEALAEAGSHAPVRMAFVDRLSIPLITQAGAGFELGFPWFAPDCAAVTQADAQSDPERQRLCADFAFSRPLLELPLAFYALAPGPLAGLTDRAGLAGAAVCVPAGLPPLLPGSDGPVPTGVVLSAGADTTDCLERLMRGEVTAVAAVRPQAERELGRLGLGQTVAELTALTTTRTLHALAPRSNPAAIAQLAALDRGMERVKQSGAWFRLVTTHNAQLARR